MDRVYRNSKNIHVSYRLSIETVRSLEAFADKHGISLTDALHTLLFAGDQTAKLAERGLDVADYSEEL